MSKDLSAEAGDVLSGKEEDRSPEDIKARRAKLMRHITGSDQQKESPTVASTAVKPDEKVVTDELYTDTLLRFGIKI